MVMTRYLHSPLDLPIVLFVVSALIGVWASYDTATSWGKFAMIVAAVALYYVLVGMRAAPQLLETFVWLFLFGCCALTLYFVTQHDYAAQPGKFGVITAIGLSLNRITPQLGLHVFDPNITAGALEIGLPLAIALSSSQKSKVKSQRRVSLSPGLLVAVFSTIVIVFGLVMTSSRGAWLALGIVGGIAVLAVAAKDVLPRYALPIGVIVVLAGFIVLVRLGDAFMPALENMLGAIPAGDTAVSRMELLGQAWGLVQDYYFTGSGLGVFPMILSTYALLIDVPFLTHVHNLFLQIWLEQGLLGFVAFVWLVAGFYRSVWDRCDALNFLARGAIAAVTVMLLHGMVDVLLYSSRGLPLLFVPFGIAVASQQAPDAGQQIKEHRKQGSEEEKKTRRLTSGAWNLKLGVVLLIVLGLFLSSFILHPSSFVALWYANLGSVEQTRVELSGFPTASWHGGRARRNGDLSQAGAYLQEALRYDSGNVTANQRLGEIAAAREQFDAAQRFLSTAQARELMNPTTWRLVANMDAARGLKTEACDIAEQAKELTWGGAWMFPLAECMAK